MAQKIYTIENLCCANCAAKIEEKFNALPEVAEATIVFPTRQLRLTCEDPDGLLEKLTRIAQSVEPDVTFHPRDSHDHPHHQEHHHCQDGCCHHDHSHEHHHDHSHSSGNDNRETGEIALGAGLFLCGLICGAINFTWGSWIAFLLSYLVLGRDILWQAAKNLFHGHVLDENFLMSIASLGALIIGEAAEGVGVMLFYRIGELFEEKAVARSRSQIMEAVDLRPEVVTLENGLTIPAENARPGDILVIRPGDRIPLDGIVLDGESRIDTAPITGEPVPVSVHPGSALVSGCVNTSGRLLLQVEKLLSESMVTRILNSVENAAASKPKIDRFITRFARIYTPIVVALAALVALIPSVITGDWNYWVYTALSFLVMSCPCALVLSVPLAFFSGIGVGSKQGILFKGGLSIEALKSVKAVVLDKTGTLTQGDFRVQKMEGKEDTLALAACCEQHSSHPIAISIAQAAHAQHIHTTEPESLEELPGRGIRAILDGKTILCGNSTLMEEAGVSLPELPAGGTRVIVACEGVYVGHLLISDTLKSGAKETVTTLKAKGIATAMLTGDSEETARSIAAETGIDEVKARLLPEEKLAALQHIRTKYGPVMYVGDGINDAPVLAGADVGAAMGSGADAAIEAADVVFMTSDVKAIPKALEIATLTGRIALENVIFALAVKILVMILGLFGHASMWMAVFADSGVAMLCVLNSIRLLYRKK